MQRDPTPPGSFDAHLPSTSYNTSPRKSNLGAPFISTSPGATGVPSHVPSGSFGGHTTQEFGGPVQPPQLFNSSGRGHSPAASWSGPDGAYTTPAFTQPPRDARDTDQTYTSPELARAGPNGPNYGGPSTGPHTGNGGAPAAGPSNGYQAPHRVERFSMPVSDEELRTTADIINGAHTFVMPFGSLNGPGGGPLGPLDFFDGPFQAHIGFPVPQPHEQDPWDKSASIHTLYSELPKESTPPLSTPPRPNGAVTESDVSRAPTVPPKDTPRISPKTVPRTLPQAGPETPKPATAVQFEEKPQTPRAAPQEKTPRLSDLHLPSDPSATPAIRLQAPTTTDPTAVTAASKSNSTPVTDSTVRSASNSSVERPKWDPAGPRNESFVTAQAQPQLPAYQSQPGSPERQRHFAEKRGASSSPPKQMPGDGAGNTGGHAPNGTGEKARKETKDRDKEKKRHSGDNKGKSRHGSHSTAPSYSTDRMPRGVDSMMSPETMTTMVSRRELKPPDYVTERLYAWATEKSEHDFVETLERLSGGDEVRTCLHKSSSLQKDLKANSRSANSR